MFSYNNFDSTVRYTVRPQDTRPQAAGTSQVHVFELGSKKFEVNKLCSKNLEQHVF